MSRATTPDTVLLLEHPSVYTAGKRTEPWERPADGTPVIDVDRGGKITWHGPGQLVGYPIVRLPDPIDVVAYVRRLEGVLIDVCAELGVAASRVEGRSGVWVAGRPRARPQDRRDRHPGRRAASPCTASRSTATRTCASSTFVPCGITDAGVTSLSQELGRDVTVARCCPLVETRCTCAHWRNAKADLA